MFHLPPDTIIPKGEDPHASNTELHWAIVDRQNERALQLIKTISAAEINKKSLGNSPLMLALKTGNYDVARAILARDDVAVCNCRFYKEDDASDYRGLTPLQIACVLRANDIIKRIVEILKKRIPSNLDLVPTAFKMEYDTESSDFLNYALSLPPATTDEIRFGIALYLLPDKFPGAYLGLPNKNAVMRMRDTIRRRGVMDIYTSDYNPNELLDFILPRYRSIIDHGNLCVTPAPELTDMALFHTQTICVNLGIKNPADFKEIPSSQWQYPSDIRIGLATLIKHRNKQPVDPEILKLFTPPTSSPTMANVKK